MNNLFTRSTLFRLAVIVMTMAASALPARADKPARQATIHLKSGEYVSGTITARTADNVEITTADGLNYVYSTDDIDYISHEARKKNYDTSRFRGFVDFGYSLGVGAPRNNYWLIETSFGYMPTPRLYVGAGIGIHSFHAIVSSYPLRTDQANPQPNDPEWHFPFIPIYAEARYNLFNESRNTPWASLKAGYSIFNHGGAFLSPSIGYHIAARQYFSFNIGVGYELHSARYKHWCTGDTPGAIPDDSGHSYLHPRTPGNPRRQAENLVEAFFTIPVRGAGNPVCDCTEDDKEEVHGKAEPDKQAGAAIAPHLADDVVEDVTDWEHDETSGHIHRSERDLFCLKHVCRDQANAEQNAVKHKQHTDSLIILLLHFLFC